MAVEKLTLNSSLGSHGGNGTECADHKVLEQLGRRLAALSAVLLEARNGRRVLVAGSTTVERAGGGRLGETALLLHGGGGGADGGRGHGCRGPEGAGGARYEGHGGGVVCVLCVGVGVECRGGREKRKEGEGQRRLGGGSGGGGVNDIEADSLEFGGCTCSS